MSSPRPSARRRGASSHPAGSVGTCASGTGNALQLEHVLGFFSLESRAGRKVPLATWTWDCGRWGWLGHIGHGIGRLLQSLDRGVPVLAIHPRDLERGFWPKILRLTEQLLESGYEPSTLAGLLEASDVEDALDAVMERRARQLMEQVGAWLPAEGPVLDLGSGTGHLSARLERERGLEVVTADVSDIHVVGPPPVLIADGVLPFEEGRFSAALLFFMLAYPNDPAACPGGSGSRHPRAPSSWCSRFIRAASVTRGFASGSSSGRSWHSTFRRSSATSRRTRSSPCVPGASIPPRSFGGKWSAAGLRVRSRRERPVLPGRSLVVAGWILERDDVRRVSPFVIPARNEEALIGEVAGSHSRECGSLVGHLAPRSLAPRYFLRGHRGR